MIVDTLKNNSRYAALHPSFAKAFAFLEKAQKELPEIGRQEIDGDKIYALVQQYETAPASERKWEAHKKYIDIQFIYSGSEIISWDTIENLPEGTDYNETKDCYVFFGEGKNPVALHGGTFAR